MANFVRLSPPHLVLYTRFAPSILPKSHLSTPLITQIMWDHSRLSSSHSQCSLHPKHRYRILSLGNTSALTQLFTVRPIHHLVILTPLGQFDAQSNWQSVVVVLGKLIRPSLSWIGLCLSQPRLRPAHCCRYPSETETLEQSHQT